jgi:hypothetical protein
MPLQPILIQSDRLTVEIAQPGSIYNRARFDWTAFITQVTLDGQHTFCVPEDYDPTKGSGGFGLCNEFGIETAIGYSDAAPGECFPKIGVGLLKKADVSAYNFFYPYEIVQPFAVEIKTQPDSVTFGVEPLDCRGYAARLTKTVRVAANTLEISYTLENTGTKTIATHEYCHNFVGIDRQPAGPDYTLRFPYPVQLEEALLTGQENFDIQGQTLRLRTTPQRPFYYRPVGFFHTSQPQWELTHASGITLRETVDFAPWRVAVWGTTHVISPEIFIDIRLAPGQSQTWARRYEFSL